MLPGAGLEAVVARQGVDSTPRSVAPCTLSWPRKMLAPPPCVPIVPRARPKIQYARVLLLPLVCWVPPMHQMMVKGRLLASVRATRLSCEPGTPVTRSTLLRVPLGNLGLDLIHAPDALADELLVLPAVLEDMPQNAPDQRHVGARPEADVLVRMGRGPGEARIAHDEGRVVLLLGLQHMLQGDRMSLGGIAADLEDGARIVDVVVAVGHRAVAPGVRNTRDRGRVTDPRLMIAVVRAPEGIELAEQIGLFVAMLGRAQPVDRIGTGAFADLEHLVADLVDRLIPADLLPLAVDHLDRMLQAALAMGVLAHRCALGAMGSQVEGAVPARLLADPDALLDLGDNGAADGTVGTDRFDLLNFALPRALRGGLLDHARRQSRRGGNATDG